LVRDEDPWHQIFKTDVFCQLATQLGPRVALHLPVVTRSFGFPMSSGCRRKSGPTMMRSKGPIP
jgi:hypothetical protein